jgi:hypothetical protein
MSVTEDGWAPCPLPGHDGMATVDWVERFKPRLHQELQLVCIGCLCEHAPDWWTIGRQFERPLSDAYRAIHVGTPVGWRYRLAKGLRFVWLLLLEHELGMVEPVSVELPPLAFDVPALGHAAREFFALLAGLRLAVGSDLLMPFSVRLVADWLRVNKAEAHEAIRTLIGAGVIAKDGEIASTGRRGTPLYAPGPSDGNAPAFGARGR